MKEAKNQEHLKTRNGTPGELRVVAINCNPAPDAQDRLRRLFTLLLELTAEEGQTLPSAEDDGSHNESENGNAG